ncbi:hypothetical protein GF312_20220 [Candidatus Poribacteria bacterium]|nr:hypothetical protein [Candidatus Poribacteria bacterium]
MTEISNIRWGWLRFMYIYTIIIAGLMGLGIVIVPEVVKNMIKVPIQEPIFFGIVGSVYLSFGLLSILGLRSPLKFVPVLLLQLCYKLIWLIGVILPLLIRGQFPKYALMSLIIFITYIIGDIIAIPFSYVFAKENETGRI